MADNIDRFDDIAKRILIALHAAFPAAAYLSPADIGLTDEQPERDQYGGLKTSEDWNKLDAVVRQTMNWLVDEGFVHDRQYKTAASHVLASKGLFALERISPDHYAPLLARL